MTNDHDKFSELRLLICESSEGSISPEGMQRLNEILLNDPQARQYYHAYVHTGIILRTLYANDQFEFNPQGNPKGTPQDYTDMFIQLAEEENRAPVIDIPKAEPENQNIKQYPQQSVNRKISRFSVYSFIFSSAAMILIAIMILYGQYRYSGSGIETATLTDSVNAKWAEYFIPIHNGTRLLTNDPPMTLEAGIAELVFDNQTRITLEGPAEFQILTDDMLRLNYGSLYAVVSDQAYGFQVSTPNSKVTDLGTEFAVVQAKNGDTEVHVIKGMTSFISNVMNRKIRLDVTEGKAHRLNGATGEVKAVACDKQRFVRRIDSTTNLIWKGQSFVDLADIVCGGNGFGTGSRENLLDPLNGKYINKNSKNLGMGSSENLLDSNIDNTNEREQKKRREYLKTDKPYILVESNPFIDGVFVPNGANNPVLVSSMQHTFSKCPETSGRFHHYISSFLFEWAKLEYELNGTQINSSEDSFIYMHANLGITFDLNQIRSQLNEISISGFEAICARELLTGENANKKAAFIVLVDGKVRFWSPKLQTGKSVPVAFDLNEADRFLTLITVDSNDNNSFDRCYYVKPKLLLETD